MSPQSGSHGGPPRGKTRTPKFLSNGLRPIPPPCLGCESEVRFGASWGLCGALGGLWGLSRDLLGGFLGPSWRPLGAIVAAIHLGADFGAVLGPSGSRLGGFLGRLGAILGASGAVLRPSWAVLGPSWGPLGPSWGRLGGLWGRLGALLGRLEAILCRLGGYLGPSWPSWKPSWPSWSHLNGRSQ